MGDVRFDRVLESLRGAADVRQALDGLTDEETIHALAAASKAKDPYWANVLATEAENRTLRLHALLDVFGDGVIRLDERGAVVLLGGTAGRLLGWTQDVLGRDAHLLLHPFCSGGEHCSLARLALGRVSTLGHGGTFAKADGTQIEVGYRGFPIHREGEAQGAALFFWPATQAPAREGGPEPDATRAPSTDGAPQPRVQLTFYVAGSRADSEAAAANLERLMERAAGAIEVTTVDIEREPGRAKADRVVATPALVRASAPSGERRVVGDLGDVDRVVEALEIKLDTTGLGDKEV